MKVLVVTPLSPREPRLYAAAYASIAALQCAGQLDVLWMRNDGATDQSDDLADKFNRAAHTAITGDYDGMLIVEYDMIVPADALARLLEVDADIAYGLYCSRLTKGHPWLMFDDIDSYDVVWPSNEARRARWGDIVETKGVGTGCTLISRRALTLIPFRVGATGAPDWSLAMDAKRIGLVQAHHCGVVCGHIMDASRVLWPDPTQPELFRIDEADSLLLLSGDSRYTVRPGHAVVNDRLRRTFRPGEIVELDPGQAALLVRKGIVACA